MAAIENYKDKILQAASPRTLRLDPFHQPYIAPDTPANFTVTTTPSESKEGNYVILADLSWDAVASDVTGYVIYYQLVGDTKVHSVKTVETYYRFTVTPTDPEEVYDAWVTAINVNEESPISTVITTAFPIDSVAPAIPVWGTPDLALGTVTLNWTNDTVNDFKYTEIMASKINDRLDVSTVTILRTSADSHTYNDLIEGEKWYIWMRSFDFSGNTLEWDVADTNGHEVTTVSDYTYLTPATPTITTPISQALNDATPEGNITANISLTWSELTENFTIYRVRAALTGTTDYIYVDSETNSYEFKNIAVGEVWDIWVKGINSTTHGAYSSMVTVLVLGDTEAPLPPSNLQADITANSATLSWDNPDPLIDRNKDFSHVEIYVSETDNFASASLTIKTSDNKFTYTDIEEDKKWFFWMFAYDFTGNASTRYPSGGGREFTTIANYIYKKPAAPQGLTLTEIISTSPQGETTSAGRITWNLVAAPITNYQIRINLPGSTDYAFFTTRGLFYDFYNLKIGDTYEVMVQAVNITSFSDHSTTESITIVGDSIRPAAPTNLQATVGLKDVTLTWVNPTDPDFSRTEVWFSATNDRSTRSLLKSTSGTSAYTAALGVGTWYFWARAKDYAGNYSLLWEPSSPTGGVEAVISENLYGKPAAPTNLQVVVSSSVNSQNNIVLTLDSTWNDVNPHTGYTLSFNLVGGGGAGNYTSPVNSLLLQNVIPDDQNYEVTVRTDYGDAYSDPSNTVIVNLARDLTPTDPCSNLTFILTLGSATLNWDNPDLTLDKNKDYDVTELWGGQVNDKGNTLAVVRLVNTSTDTYTFSNVTAGETWYFWLIAIDRSGNKSLQYPASDTNGISATTVGEFGYSEPSTPTGLSFTEDWVILVGAGFIPVGVVSWTASPETVTIYTVRVNVTGSTDYIYYDTTGTEYRLDNLEVGVSYDATVQAVNITSKSTFATYETLVIDGDTIDPSAPTSLAAIGTAGGISITWTNPVDQDFRHTEIWGGKVNDRNDVGTFRVCEVLGDRLFHADVNDGETWYYWSKSRDVAWNDSTWEPVSATGGASATFNIGSSVRSKEVITDLGSVASGTVTPNFDTGSNIFKLTLTGAGVTINPPTITLGTNEVVTGRININGGDTYQPIWGAGWDWNDDGEPEMLSTSLIGYTKADGDTNVTGWQHGRTADDLLKFN